MRKILLSDLIATTQEVEISEGNFVPARPLMLTEIATLVIRYKESFLALYNESQSLDPNYPLVLAAVPDMVTDIIVMGCELEDQRETVKALPPAVQLQLIASVWELSVPDAKKLVESLSKLMGQAKRIAEASRLSTSPASSSAPLSDSTST